MKVIYRIASIVAIVHAATLASIKFPDWGSPIFDPTLNTHTCYSCIRSHHNWIFDADRLYHVEATAVTANDLVSQACCQDTYTTLTNGNCPKYKNSGGAVISGRIASEQMLPDLALAACP